MGDVKKNSLNQSKVEEVFLATHSNKRWYEEKLVKVFTFTFYWPCLKLSGTNILISTLGTDNLESRPAISK